MARSHAANDAWAEFAALGAELADLEGIGALLGWDQETMMPPRGVGARAHQRATLDGLAHDRLTAPRVGQLLDQLEQAAAAHPEQFDLPRRAQIRELRRDYRRAVKLPRQLVQDLAHATAIGYQTWCEARAANDWPRFVPALDRIVELERQVARRLAEGAGDPYDALLDLFEPGMTVARLEPIFQELRPALVALLGKICQHPAPSEAPVQQPFEVDQQWVLARQLLGLIGFRPDAGRLDPSPHPFDTRIGRDDVRLTDRVNPNDLRVAIFGVLHEGGHALYDQNLPASLDRTSVGTAPSTGVHESQSRFWENLVGRSAAFWRYVLPWAQAIFPRQLGETSLEDLVRAINVVRPSFIRTDADEVTYNLHIIIRFELERGLIAGTLPVAELPSRWNALMQQYLGITPPDARQGVLQDPHWAQGMFGYFPSYTLGNVYAAQLWQAMQRDLPDVEARIASGDLAPLREWLWSHLWQHGAIYPPIELITRATGEAPTSRYLIAYLERKFGALYGLAPAVVATG